MKPNINIIGSNLREYEFGGSENKREKHRNYVREWRAKQKAKTDEIESQLKQQTKKVTQQPRIKKRNNHFRR